MSTSVYINGLNLYYGALRGTPYKWLNLLEMAHRLLPGRDSYLIRYFTARTISFPHDEQAPARQDIYLRALSTIPEIVVHHGRFVSRPAYAPRYPLVYSDPLQPPELVRILRNEEKRSDVNLATMLLADCFDNQFDEAVVVTNDSDLTLPIEHVISRFKKSVGVINPHRNSRVSIELIQAATWHYRQINRSILAASQFPASMRDARGPFHKPASW